MNANLRALFIVALMLAGPAASAQYTGGNGRGDHMGSTGLGFLDDWYAMFVGGNGRGDHMAQENGLQISPCVNPTDGGTIGIAQTICYNTTPSTLTQTAAPGGSPVGTLQYQWQSSANGTDFNNIIENGTSEGFSPPALLANTWYKRLVKVDCETVWLASNVVKLTVRATTASTDYFRSVATGNWSSTSSWESSSDNINWCPATSVPTSDATEVKIISNHTVAVDGDFECSNLLIGDNVSHATLTFSGTDPSLTVYGPVFIGSTVNQNDVGRITFTADATLTCNSLTVGTNKTGVTQNINVLQMAAGGTLITGSLAVDNTFGITDPAWNPYWNPGLGTVVMTGTSTLPSTIFISFNNLQVQAGGALTFSANKAIAGNFSIGSAATANLGTYSHTAGTLTMGGAGRVNGTWGHSASAATYENDTYFANATGIVTVGTSSCTEPDFELDVAHVTCFGDSNGSIEITVTGGIPNYEFSKDGGSTWTAPQASNIYTFGSLTAAGGPYPIAVRDGSGCVQTTCP